MTPEIVYVTHQARRLAENSGECLEYLHCRGEAAYQSPIAIAIFFEGFFAAMK